MLYRRLSVGVAAISRFVVKLGGVQKAMAASMEATNAKTTTRPRSAPSRASPAQLSAQGGALPAAGAEEERVVRDERGGLVGQGGGAVARLPHKRAPQI
jgi:hypothetical protein